MSVWDSGIARGNQEPVHTTDGNARSMRNKVMSSEVMGRTNVKSNMLSVQSIKFRIKV